MPFYTFLSDTGETVDKFFKISERPNSLELDGVVYNYVISSPSIVSGVGGYKIPSNLKDKMNAIKKHYPKMQSTITG